MAAPVDLVIFGGSGDLTKRKVLPALAGLKQRGALPRDLRVIGAGRSELTSEEFQKRVEAAPAEWVRLDYADAGTYDALKAKLDPARTAIFYLATPPSTFIDVVRSLARADLSGKDGAERRIVLEKPLGQDLASARELNRELARVFDEPRIFRIDHYLAKDTVQNVLA